MTNEQWARIEPFARAKREADRASREFNASLPSAGLTENQWLGMMRHEQAQRLAQKAYQLAVYHACEVPMESVNPDLVGDRWPGWKWPLVDIRMGSERSLRKWRCGADGYWSIDDPDRMIVYHVQEFLDEPGKWMGIDVDKTLATPRNESTSWWWTISWKAFNSVEEAMASFDEFLDRRPYVPGYHEPGYEGQKFVERESMLPKGWYFKTSLHIARDQNGISRNVVRNEDVFEWEVFRTDDESQKKVSGKSFYVADAIAKAEAHAQAFEV